MRTEATFRSKGKETQRFVFFPDAASAIIQDWTTLSVRLFTYPLLGSLLLPPISCLIMPKQDNYPLALTETARRPRVYRNYRFIRRIVAPQYPLPACFNYSSYQNYQRLPLKVQSLISNILILNVLRMSVAGRRILMIHS